MKTIEFDVKIPKELTFVNLCTGLVHHGSEFISDMTITTNDHQTNPVDLKSILGIMSLAMSNGKHVIITISGEDEDRAETVIKSYAEKFSA